MGKYLTFVEKHVEGRKTQTYVVMSVQGGACLGHVRWYSQWRRYTFMPLEGCASLVFDATCLREAAEFIDSLMRKRKEESCATR